MIKTKNKILRSVLLASLSILALFGICTLSDNANLVYASGNTPIQTITGYEKHSHVVEQSLLGNATSYTESKYKNTGVQIYASNNTGSSYSGTSLELDATSFYVDFSSASSLYKPSTAYEGMVATTNYRFEIKNSSGYTSWYYDYSVDITQESPYSRVFNANGTKTTKIDSEGEDVWNFTPTEMGKKLVTLYNGEFTWSLTRTYIWIRYDIDNSVMATYTATSELTGTLLIDTYTPTLTLKGYSSGKTISDGSYVNERVTVTGSDTNFYGIYYKLPSNTGFYYTSSKNYTSTTTHGWWTVYVKDEVGNVSKEYTFYYDTTKPVGTISSNGSTVASGSYVSNSFAYTVTDAHSGIKNIYYKSPVNGTYQPYTSGTIIPSTAGDGWYYFYAVDNAGNVSTTQSIYLETQAPLMQIYRNGSVVYSGSITGSGTIDTGVYFNKNDVLKITYDSSSDKVDCNYSLNTNITLGSTYTNSNYNIQIETATGITANYTFHIVDTKPYIMLNGTKYTNGSKVFVNTDTFVSWYDDSDITNSKDTGVKIVSEGNINIDESYTYSTSGKTLTTLDETETTYYLTLNDVAGNISTFTIVVDKVPPIASWIADGEVIENGGYTNKPVTLDFDSMNARGTYSKDGSEYVNYYKGTEFSEDGTYTVILNDQAKNKSTFTITIDTVKPSGQLYADYEAVETGSITNGKIYFTWDGDNTATVNGEEYTRNTVISEDGTYEFILKDKAGNSETYVIEIDTIAPSYNNQLINSSEDYLVGKWYIVDFDDSKTSFATYESALEFACSKEFEKYVTSLELDDVNNFTQYHLIASRGNQQDDVRVGTYFRYKSQANPNNELYYFDETLLEEVITYYAKEYVSKVNYYNLEENVYGDISDNMFDNIWTTTDGINAPIINNYSFIQFDSSEVYAELVGSGEGKVKVEFNVPFDEQFNITGLYEITEVDEAGNSYSYYVFLDKSAPEIVVNAEVFGEGENREITISKDSVSNITTYYYKSFEITSIIDNDSWSTIAITNDGLTTYYSKGDELPTLNVGGKYNISVYDRVGNSYSFVVYIVGNEASIEFNPNSDSTAFEIDITLEQEFDTIVSLEIYKDGEKLDGVTTDTLTYTFTKDGTYTVVLRDNFGRVIERTYEFDKSLPNGSLSIDNESRTTEEVTFTFDNSKYSAEISLNGQAIETNTTGEIIVSNDGDYSIKLINLTDSDNVNTYSFTIDTKAPEVNLDNVNPNETTNKDVTVSWNDEDVISATYTLNNGELFTFENGTTFTEEGIYVVKVFDDLGNETVVMFTIDKSLNYEVYVDNTSTTGVETTGEDVVLINNEDLKIEVLKDGESFDYTFGEVLSEEGIYLIKIYDSYGNTTTIAITIDKSVDAYLTVGNGSISNDEVIITAGEKVSIIVTQDGKPYVYSLGESIAEEGKYEVTIYDAYGNKQTYNFEIVKGTKNVLDYTLGENVEIIEVKKDGEVIDWTSNTLNFTEDGTYEIKVMVDSVEYKFNLSLDTTAPEITLNGIENGEAGNVTVTITDMTEEGKVEVYKDGVLIDYNLGDELEEYGNYEVKVTDELGNSRTYTFTLEYQMNGWAIALIVIGVLAVAGIIVLICLKRKGTFKN